MKLNRWPHKSARFFRKPRPTRLRLESLEDRLLLAGDISDTLTHALNTRLAGPGSYTEVSQPIGNGRYDARDVDLYQFKSNGNELLKVTKDTPTDGEFAETYLRLFDSNGNELPGGYGSSVGNSLLEYDFATAGTYYLGVSSYPNGRAVPSSPKSL